MTLHRWAELECGSDAGAIERDEKTGIPYFRYDYGARQSGRYVIPDRERGALKRLAAIMSRYPGLGYYLQGDCRGAPLYVLRPGDIPDGAKAESYYTRGVAVYK
jgi:hypothetical protein